MKPTANGIRTGLKTAPRTQPGKAAPAAAPRSWKKRLLTAAAVLLLLGGGVFAYMALRPDAQVTQLKDLRARMADKELSPEERRETGRQFREGVRQLSDQQRYELDAEDNQKRREKLREFFSQSREDILAQLSQQQGRRGQGQQGQFVVGGGPGVGFGGNGVPGGGGGPGIVFGGGQGNRGNGPNGAGNPAAGGNPGAAGQSQNREQRQKNAIDASTVEDRAFGHAMRELRQQARNMAGRGGRPPGGP